MDPEFWRQRWRDGRTGFHNAAPAELLLQHWPSLALPPDSRVFVPLAGKSLDLGWLAAQGHRVLGVELSPLAVAQFFATRALTPEVHDSRYGCHHRAGDIELICGNVFDLDAEVLAACAAFYDRAALIALPPEMRRRYVRQVQACMPRGSQGLLITLEYSQQEKDGPPFAVPETEVRDLYGRDWHVNTLARHDILAHQPGFIAEGCTALSTAVYRLARR